MFTARASFPYAFRTRRHRRHRHYGKPDNHRNIPSAFFGLVVTGLFAVTMAEPNWFRLNGGQCTGKHLGLYAIFGMNVEHIKDSCMTHNILTKLQVCASLTLLGAISSMFQFALDVCGANKRFLKWIRTNAIGHIICVLTTIILMGICYWITVDVSKIQLVGTVHVRATFDVAFFLIIGSGVAAFIATTLSLLQITCEKRTRRHPHRGSDTQLQLICNNSDVNMILDDMPPVYPPAYQP